MKIKIHMKKKEIKNSIKRVGIEYGILAAVYLSLISITINSLLRNQEHNTLTVTAILWLCTLLFVASLFPYGIEKKHLLDDKRSVALYASFSFAVFFIFFSLLVGLGFTIFLNIKLIIILKLIASSLIPIFISTLLFYSITVWLFDGMKTEKAN
jgi:hypothetical protein